MLVTMPCRPQEARAVGGGKSPAARAGVALR